MVDGIKAPGAFPGIVTTKRTEDVSQEKRSKPAEEAKKTEKRNEVSAKELSQAQAEQAARETRDQLKKEDELTLGLNPGFDETV